MLLWILFTIGIVIALGLDLGVFNRRAHAIRTREALAWTIAWVLLASAFAGLLFVRKGAEAGVLFITGYLIELSLSVDNVFLFAVIFTSFRVPMKYQRRVLFWGILSAVAMRGVMIWAGVAMIKQFHWAIYVFGIFLIFTGLRMLLHKEEKTDVTENALITWLRRHVRLTNQYHGQSFWTRIDGKLYATPLFLVLALVETTDLMFALDSIPAILAISDDPFIIFTSNVFAILGLRSMYFLLAGVMDRFHYLKFGLAGVLMFVGLKMLELFEIHNVVSLVIVATILGTSIVVSWMRPVKSGPQMEPPSVLPYDQNEEK